MKQVTEQVSWDGASCRLKHAEVAIKCSNSHIHCGRCEAVTMKRSRQHALVDLLATNCIGGCSDDVGHVYWTRS